MRFLENEIGLYLTHFSVFWVLFLILHDLKSPEWVVSEEIHECRKE